MDQNYLSHIESSPYVDESFLPAAWKAKGAGLAQYFKNKMGVGVKQSPHQTKLLSYNTSFINEVKNLLRMFLAGSVVRRMKKDPRFTAEHKEMLRKLNALYESLLAPAVASPPDPMSGFDPSIEESDTPTISLTQAVSRVTEGWTDDLTDPSKILPMVLYNLKKVYDKFAVRIQKEFGVPPSFEISKFFERQLRNHPASKNIASVEKFIKDTETFGIVTPPAETPTAATPSTTSPTTTPSSTPVAKPTTGPALGANGGKGVKLSSQQNARDLAYLMELVLKIISNKVMTSSSSHPTKYYAKPLASGGYHLPQKPDEPEPTDPKWTYPELPDKLQGMSQDALDALDPDSIEGKAYQIYRKKMAEYPYTHVGGTHDSPEKYIYKTTGVPPVPASQMDADIAKFLASKSAKKGVTETDEASADEPAVDTPPIQKKKEDEEDETDDDILKSGDFLYTIGGLYRKHPGKYSLEVTEPNGIQAQFPSGKVKVIRVFWQWESTINTIHVQQRYPDDTDWMMYPVMRFSDGEILSGKPPEVINFVQALNPRLASLLEKAPDKAGLQNATQVFAPAAYAIARRKGPMEHKAYKSLKFHIEPEWKLSKPGDPNYGKVKLLYGKFAPYKRGQDIPMEALQQYYFGKKTESERKEIEDALKECEYWESYANINEVFYSAPPLTPGKEGVSWKKDGTILYQYKGQNTPNEMNPMEKQPDGKYAIEHLGPSFLNQLAQNKYWDWFPNMPGNPEKTELEPTEIPITHAPASPSNVAPPSEPTSGPFNPLSVTLNPKVNWSYTPQKDGIILSDGTNSTTLTHKDVAYLVVNPYNAEIPSWPRENRETLINILKVIGYFEHTPEAQKYVQQYKQIKHTWKSQVKKKKKPDTTTSPPVPTEPKPGQVTGDPATGWPKGTETWTEPPQQPPVQAPAETPPKTPSVIQPQVEPILFDLDSEWSITPYDNGYFKILAGGDSPIEATLEDILKQIVDDHSEKWPLLARVKLLSTLMKSGILKPEDQKTFAVYKPKIDALISQLKQSTSPKLKSKTTKSKKPEKIVEPSKEVPEKPAAAVDPEEKPETNLGKVSWNNKTGVVKWIKPDGSVRQFTPTYLKNTWSDKLWPALHKAGYPFDKFGVKKTAVPETKPTKPTKKKKKTNENFINPFQFANLL